MKYNETIFDDVVIEENNKWSQICKYCAEKYFSDEVWDEIPAEGFTCGDYIPQVIAPLSTSLGVA